MIVETGNLKLENKNSFKLPVTSFKASFANKNEENNKINAKSTNR